MRDFIFRGSKITADGDYSHEIKRCLLLGSQAMTNLDSILNSRDITPSSQSYVFSSSHVWTWELDYKESWLLKNWCFWTVVLEKTLESPLESKEVKSVISTGNQSWIFIGRTDAEAETPILQPPDMKSSLTGKVPDAGKDWGQAKATTEKEILQSMGSQRVRHGWMTELNWSKLIIKFEGAAKVFMKALHGVRDLSFLVEGMGWQEGKLSCPCRFFFLSRLHFWFGEFKNLPT